MFDLSKGGNLRLEQEIIPQEYVISRIEAYGKY